MSACHGRRFLHADPHPGDFFVLPGNVPAVVALVVASTLLMPQEGTALGLFDLQSMGIFGYIIAAVIGVWLLVFIIRRGKL